MELDLHQSKRSYLNNESIPKMARSLLKRKYAANATYIDLARDFLKLVLEYAVKSINQNGEYEVGDDGVSGYI